MTQTYFKQNNWEPFAYQRLNQLIHQYKNDPDAYVVFDFDNTSIIMDIEDNYMIYALDNLLYHLTPEDFHQMLLSGPFNFDLLINDQATVKDLADDIAEAYTYLYHNYIKLASNEKTPHLLAQIKLTPAFLDFQAKYRAYYLFTNRAFTRKPGEPWLNYHFSGQSKESYYQACLEMFPIMEQQPFKRHAFISATSGKAGGITSTYTSGLSMPQETKDLYRAFQENGIDVYIISASPIDIVRAANDYYQLKVAADHLIAMEYPIQNGLIQPMSLMQSFITKGPGKTEAIKKAIMPHHHHREPIAVFGDSKGDYNMMLDFDTLEIAVLFNVLSDDIIQEIVDKAIATYGEDNARYLLQGRNEQLGCLQPSQATLAIGATEAYIKPHKE